MKTTEIYIVHCEKVINDEKEHIINVFKNKEQAQDYFNTLVDSFASLVHKANWQEDESCDAVTNYYSYENIKEYWKDHIEIELKTQKLK